MSVPHNIVMDVNNVMMGPCIILSLCPYRASNILFIADLALHLGSGSWGLTNTCFFKGFVTSGFRLEGQSDS